MEQLKITVKATKPQKIFSEVFKKQVVREFEEGLLNKDQLQRKYSLGGNSTVLKWCRKYGKFAYPQKKSCGRPMKDPQKQRIKELEAKLKAAEQKLKVYDKLIEITNRELTPGHHKKNRSQVVRELATQKEISISAVCRQLGYSKQAYYKSLQHTRHKSCVKARARLQVLSIRRHLPRLGTRKLHYLLANSFSEHGVRIGRDALFKLLREENLLVGKKKRYTKTTNSKHWMRKYPDLVQGKIPGKPQQLWVADITYIAMEESFSYLHLITDAYSKKIVGYHLSDDLSAEASLQALKMAVGQSQCLSGLIHHSDRGLQYCSSLYTSLLESKNVAISMTQTGSPYDNAVAERINGILKDEFALDAVFTDKQQLIVQLKQSVAAYNTKRPHYSNHMLTPVQMHQQQALNPKTCRTKKAQEL